MSNATSRLRVVRDILSAALGLALFSAAPAAADLSVAALVDRNQVAVGEAFSLSIEVTGAQNVPAPDLGDVGPFQARYLGPASQVSIVNGQMSSSVSHRYTLVARQPGHFVLGPFGVEYGGRRYATQPVAVDVAAQGQARAGGSGGGVADIRLTVSSAKQQAYVGERVPVTVKLHLGNVRVDNLQFPRLAGEGFTVEQFPQPTQQDEVVGGRRYRTLTMVTTLTPLRAGPLTVGPTTMGMQVFTRRRQGGLFGDAFFGDMFGEATPYEAQAEPFTVAVLPLPDAGRPPDFAGAVGRFDFAMEVKPTELNAGDPVTVRMRISGSGNLSTVGPPKIVADDRFRVYDPQVVKDEEEAGVRTFEQVLIPKEAGISELPAARFSFFDVEAGRYQTITRGPVPLTVRAAAPAAGPQVIAAVAPAAAPERPPETLGRDIVYIKDVPGVLRGRGVPFYRTWWWIVLHGVPVAGFVCVRSLLRRRERLAADPRLLRFRQAGREARRALTDLGRTGPDARRFYDDLTGATYGYLGAKLDLPPGAVEPARVAERLRAAGGAPELLQSVSAFFAIVERVRYAASPGEQDRAEALAVARDIVDRLERDRAVTAHFASGLLLVLLCVALSAAGAVAQSAGNVGSDPHTAFYEGNAAYRDGRYADAVRAYERVRAAGVESGALYFNLGNAYFKNRQTGLAILNYERAMRWLPRDPDVHANLAYARQVAQDVEEDASVWERLLLFLGGRATTGELATAAGALWCALWALLATRLAVPRWGTGLWRGALLTGALCAVCAGNLAARVVRTEVGRTVVVTVSGQTPVRFEPAPSGTEYFRVHEGVLLEVTEQREGWWQVRRRDGRRGWVSADAVTEM